MSSPSKPPPIAEAVRGSLAYAARAREHLRAGIGDARAAKLTPPPADQHVRRFLFGFTLPLTLMRISWSNTGIQQSIRGRLLPPLLLVGLVATIGVAQIVTSIVNHRHEAATLALEVEDDKEDKDDEGATPRAKEGPDDDDPIAKESVEAIANAAKEAKEKGGSLVDLSAAAIAATRKEEASLEARARADKAARESAKAKAAAAKVAAPRGVYQVLWDFLMSKTAKLVATLSALEWILVWIGREHHDQIAYDMAVLTGVPGEALAAPPRLRFDLAWLKLKAWRALRLLLFFSLALPLAWVVGMIPYVGESFAVAIEGAWAAYWACVFAVGNTFLVWEAPAGPRSPWFLRALQAVGRVPVLGAPVRLYARLVARVTRNVWPACLAFEETTWESAGMALARTIASVPVAYIITRPAFAAAATHAWLARAGQPCAGDANLGSAA
jgi:hypothetical protein